MARDASKAGRSGRGAKAGDHKISKSPAPLQRQPASSPARQVNQDGGAAQGQRDRRYRDAETHRTFAHLIMAKGADVASAGRALPHYASLTEVGFEINCDGHLVSDHVAQGSGSSAEADMAQLSFVVPISFESCRVKGHSKD